MLTECFNPECRKELDYLRSGRVIRMIRASTPEMLVEHFWLCGSCYATHDFEFKTDGTVTLSAKPRLIASNVSSLTDYFVR